MDVGSRNAFSDSTILPTDVCNATTWHVLQINAENIVLNDLATKIAHYVFVVQIFVSVYLFLYSFGFRLVKALDWMNKLNLLNDKHFS